MHKHKAERALTETSVGFKTSKLIPSDITSLCPPTRPWLLILPKWFYHLGTKEVFLIQTTTAIKKMPHKDGPKLICCTILFFR